MRREQLAFEPIASEKATTRGTNVRDLAPRPPLAMLKALSAASVVAVCNSLNNVLNNNIADSRVVAIDVLSGGSVIAFYR